MTTDIARTDDVMRQFSNELTRLEDEFAKAIPAQMQASKFVRCIMTAVQRDPKLLRCDRKSLWGAAMQAAHDGLYPDGRYGVILPYSVNVAKKGETAKWAMAAQWQPMILGVYQKLHNSGKLADIAAHLVYENDFFEYHAGDDERFLHRPVVFGDRGKVLGVYAIAHATNGGVYREIMSVAEVERIRGFSKSKDSPAWRDHWNEMAKVKCVRRLAKRLPISADDMSWLMDEDGELTLATPIPSRTINALPAGYPPGEQKESKVAWDDIAATADQRAAELNELPSDVEPPPPEDAA